VASVTDSKVEAGDRLSWQLWLEANQTAQIQQELWRLAEAYQLVPIRDDQIANVAPVVIREQYLSVLNWVLHGDAVPSFLHSETLLLESRPAGGVKRTIHPHKWASGSARKVAPRIKETTRVRTWTVYYLTRRGGGKLTEPDAVELWNREFHDNLDVRNYRAERDRLLLHQSKKG
jgi:hypothetical protein